MLALILALFAPESQACIPEPANALWGFPSDLSSDVAINQPLQFKIDAGGYGDVSFSVWNSTTEAPIEGTVSFTCSDDPNGRDQCIATFMPDGGSWNPNTPISWSATPSEDFMPSLSGSFSTSDQVSPAKLPEAVSIQAEMLEWKPVENECDSVETIRIDMSLESDFWQEGSLVQILHEGKSDDSTQPEELTEPLVVHQILVRDGTEMNVQFDILASEEEQCFTVWVQSADTLDFQQYDGLCLQWSSHVPGSGIGCATSKGSRSQRMAWATLFLALGLRRRRTS